MGKRHGLSLRLISIYAAFFTAAALAYAAISPIPLDSEGHVLFRTGAVGRVQVEIYLDLACSDCAMTWPTILEAANEYREGADFIFRLFPLPYHHNAFTAAQAAQVVRRYTNGDAEEIEYFVQRVFDGQARILNSPTADMSQADILDIFAEWAMASGTVTSEMFEIGMADSALDERARNQFKYGCLHGVFGTPMVFVGGVQAPPLTSSTATLQIWRQVLDEVVPDVYVDKAIEGQDKNVHVGSIFTQQAA